MLSPNPHQLRANWLKSFRTVAIIFWGFQDFLIYLAKYFFITFKFSWLHYSTIFCSYYSSVVWRNSNCPFSSQQYLHNCKSRLLALNVLITQDLNIDYFKFSLNPAKNETYNAQEAFVSFLEPLQNDLETFMGLWKFGDDLLIPGVLWKVRESRDRHHIFLLILSPFK